MKVSIVIPVKKINDYVRESIPHILNLDYTDFEILLFPDYSTNETFPKTKIIPTGKMGPAKKRDLAIQYARGEVLAFLDDDAYPKKDWLKQALPHFYDQNIAAVGGPAVTPTNDSFSQKVSGAVFLSCFSGGNPERYWPMGRIKEIDDWPSVNFLVRKSDFIKIGGFDSTYWPGEDTKLCLDLIQKLQKKIIYEPNALVWHHRRSGIKTHLKQIGNYGLHRGFFAKKYPKNSLKLKYFIPSCFLIFILFSWILLFSSYKIIYLSIWLIYFAALAFALISIYYKIRDIKVSLCALPYIFATHIFYGWRFIQGFIFTKNLKQ